MGRAMRARVMGSRAAAVLDGHIIVTLLALAVLFSSACRKTEAGSCEFWTGKLGSETDELAAVKGLAEQKCEGASEALSDHLKASRVPGEVVAALKALGPSEAARAALRGALNDERIAEAAVGVLVEWKDAGAVDAVRAALVADGAARRRGALLDAGLTLAGGSPDALLDEIAAVAASDPALQGMEVNRRAAALLAEGAAGELTAERRAHLGALASTAALRPPLRADAVMAGALRLASARLGVPDPAALVAALVDEDPARPLLSEILWDAGAGAEALAAHAAQVLRTDDATTPHRLLDVATAAVAVTRDAAPVSPLVALLVDVPNRRMDVAQALGLVGASAPLWERFAAETGAARAALVPALAHAIEDGDLARWDADVQASPSALVREVGADVGASAAIAALRSAQGGRPWVVQLQELAPKLPPLGAALAAAREAHEGARAEADAEVKRLTDGFHEKEQKGELGTPEARRAEMDRLRERRDAIFAPLAPLRQALEAQVAVKEATLRALLGLVRAAEVPAGAWAAAAAVYEGAVGDELAQVRLWAAVALERLSVAGDVQGLRELAAKHLTDRSAVHLLGVATRLGL